jgi:hypothetical protein
MFYPFTSKEEKMAKCEKCGAEVDDACSCGNCEGCCTCEKEKPAEEKPAEGAEEAPRLFYFLF